MNFMSSMCINTYDYNGYPMLYIYINVLAGQKPCGHDVHPRIRMAIPEIFGEDHINGLY